MKQEQIKLDTSFQARNLKKKKLQMKNWQKSKGCDIDRRKKRAS